MIDFVVTNWVMIIVGFVIGFIIGNYIRNFIKQPTEVQLNSVKEWLLWAVAAAEKELGSGTGQLKLRYVYGMFTQTFESFAKFLTFETFSSLVDEALVKFSEMMKTNKNVVNYVKENKE